MYYTLQSIPFLFVPIVSFAYWFFKVISLNLWNRYPSPPKSFSPFVFFLGTLWRLFLFSLSFQAWSFLSKAPLGIWLWILTWHGLIELARATQKGTSESPSTGPFQQDSSLFFKLPSTDWNSITKDNVYYSCYTSLLLQWSSFRMSYQQGKWERPDPPLSRQE